MLVLSRKEKETILVGDNIEITICRVSGRRVTIGVNAPSDVTIRRGEVGDSRKRCRKSTRRASLRLFCSASSTPPTDAAREVTVE